MPETPVSERSLPHNLEAEKAVLGAVLIDNEQFNRAAELIDSPDFYRHAHQQIFDKMVSLFERDEVIDLVTLKEELNRAGNLNEVGGPAYIAALVDGVPKSTNVEYYAKIVKEKATLRSLIGSANKILTTAYQAEVEPEVQLDQAESEIFQIADGRLTEGFQSLRDLVPGGLETLEKLENQQGFLTGVPSGFTDLDRLTSGFQPSDLVIIAARPSMGKTSLALNIAQHVATKTEKTVGVFSLEMSKQALFLRMLTSEARIDAHKFRGGFLGSEEYKKLSEALGVLGEARVFIDDSTSLSVLEMRAKARRLKSEHGLHLLIIDYLQLMQGRGRFENRNLELASISRSLKGLAKELEVPVVALSQLSRAPESRSEHRPQLSDLRESGALEQDADVVLFIYREDVYDRKPENENTAEVIIGKQRNGPTGTVRLAFLKEITRFENQTTTHH
ncbi:MAG: replicative DNA helicase [Vicinamibacterales bacterium]|jgi:replicative DNA helicase|nr:replicative DNA helicase [Vicinamibacterales bacterium]HJO17514.1 replicative DNA helicase [Vicinamibacterales bacterium]|tara:strand:- start:98913 stop:100253 length:1341 start_codon:yes stop_codon:yes gene_type:complete